LPQDRRYGYQNNSILVKSLSMRLKMEAKSTTLKQRTPLIIAGIVLGLGLGGFVDGILLHQLLQWHHMLSNIRPLTNVANEDLNMIWDGLFHAFDWVLTVAGIILLWRAGGRDDVPWSSQTFIGSILIGAGLFDVVEGLIDHQILGIHHVKPGPNQLAWDLGFLAFGGLLAVIGWIMIKKDSIE
jgi:uncharacterized membrane protein